MTRSILATLAAAVAVTIVSGTGCNNSGVGDPCIPVAEYDPSFLGFSIQQVNLETNSFQCQTRLCLANHFQGRVTCPYGQGSQSGGPATVAFDGTSGSTGCETPVSTPVTGCPSGSTVNGGNCVGGSQGTIPIASPPAGGFGISAGLVGPGSVDPNCQDRQAANAVYCSCRCANIDGQTNDGAVYCKCPSGFSCTQLVSSIGAVAEEITGAYCVKSNTDFDSNSSCQTTCQASQGNCGTAQGVTGK